MNIDSINNGIVIDHIQAGKSAGCKTVHIGDPREVYGQDITVSCLKDFADHYIK